MTIFSNFDFKSTLTSFLVLSACLGSYDLEAGKRKREEEKGITGPVVKQSRVEAENHDFSEDNGEDAPINMLPSEMMVSIFSHLTPKDMASVAGTCKLWNHLGQDDSLWHHFAIKDDLLGKSSTESWKEYYRISTSWGFEYKLRLDYKLSDPENLRHENLILPSMSICNTKSHDGKRDLTWNEGSNEDNGYPEITELSVRVKDNSEGGYTDISMPRDLLHWHDKKEDIQYQLFYPFLSPSGKKVFGDAYGQIDGCFVNAKFMWPVGTSSIFLWKGQYTVNDVIGNGEIMVGKRNDGYLDPLPVVLRIDPQTSEPIQSYLLFDQADNLDQRGDAVAVNYDGTVIGGWSGKSNITYSAKAFLWTSETGRLDFTKTLDQHLKNAQSRAAFEQIKSLMWVTKINDRGSDIVGLGLEKSGKQIIWRAKIPAVSILKKPLGK